MFNAISRQAHQAWKIIFGFQGFTDIIRNCNREEERERERQTDRQADRQTDRERERDRERSCLVN